MKKVALIPARAGSKRVKSKNMALLGGKPLVAHTILNAIESRIFDRVIVSTDSEEIAQIAREYGAEVPFLRPQEMAQDLSPDIEWVIYTLEKIECEIFSILRPTSPFRRPETIRRAMDLFFGKPGFDSLRAVELCKQHPYKMWVSDGDAIKPFMPDQGEPPEKYSSAYQSLPQIYVQNASLEIAWAKIPLEKKSIAGDRVIPFFTEGFEGFDINYPHDLILAEIIWSQNYKNHENK